MNCPKCAGQKLAHVQAGGVKVDQCDHCGGLWLDQSELGQLLELEESVVKSLRRGQTRAGADHQRGKCPRCHHEMLRVASAIRRDVTVDKCPDCGGVWLDGGEFARLSAVAGD